jgi:exodeoxyribonuclease-3
MAKTTKIIRGERSLRGQVWDYRGAGYRANAGLRIDLVLSSGELLKHSTASWIDEAPRKHERPSDHTPVIVEYSI